MSPKEHVEALAEQLRPYFSEIVEANANIRRLLETHADGKKLKGDEIVGWLGEIFGKLLLGGRLVPDDLEHDFEIRDMHVSVKARKGWASGWRQSSAIPTVEGLDCPSHLMFVHLNYDYSLDCIWLYPWSDLLVAGRFKPHVVRGKQRSFVFHVNPSADHMYLEYPEKNAASSSVPLSLTAPTPQRALDSKTIPWSSDLARLVKNRRRDMGLTQADVGKLTGIGRQRYSWIEYPKIISTPRRDELERIIQALKIAPSAFGLEE